MNFAKAIATITLALCAVRAAVAGPLATDPNALDDGSRIWHDSITFSSGALQGYMDWAVYAPGYRPAGFSGAAFPANHYIYTYQAFSTGTVPLESVLIDMPPYSFGDTGNVGTFTATGVSGQAASTVTYIPEVSSTWTFEGVPQDGSTVGLILSSLNRPEYTLAHVSGDMITADVIAVPIPDNTMPEPSAVGNPWFHRPCRVELAQEAASALARLLTHRS